jgi:hypothetical protein
MRGCLLSSWCPTVANVLALLGGSGDGSQRGHGTYGNALLSWVLAAGKSAHCRRRCIRQLPRNGAKVPAFVVKRGTISCMPDKSSGDFEGFYTPLETFASVTAPGTPGELWLIRRYGRLPRDQADVNDEIRELRLEALQAYLQAGVVGSSLHESDDQGFVDALADDT